MGGDILLLEIMKEYGWSWQELKSTPASIVRLAIEKRRIEEKKRPKEE